MTYLWDTTTFSVLMRRDAKVRARLAARTLADRVVICTITRGEVLYGLARLPEGKRRSALEAEAMSLFRQLVCLAVPEAAADQYAAIKWETERKGTPLDDNDLWIAATARALEAVGRCQLVDQPMQVLPGVAYLPYENRHASQSLQESSLPGRDH